MQPQGISYRTTYTVPIAQSIFDGSLSEVSTMFGPAGCRACDEAQPRVTFITLSHQDVDDKYHGMLELHCLAEELDSAL